MDFRGINAKIERARGQIAALSADIDELCTTIGQSIIHEIDREAGEQRWIFRGATPDVPIEWSIRAGEVLYNLRSALDHLVWQLVLANGNEPTRDNQFPILNVEDEWTSRTVRSLNGVSDENRKRVQLLQPFNHSLRLPIDGAPRDIDAYALRTLRDLSNIDKHRHLNLIVAGTRGVTPISYGRNHPPLRSGAGPLTGNGNRGRGIVRRGQIVPDMIFLTADDVEQEMRPRFVIGVHFHCLKQQFLTPKSVQVQLRECFEAVQGGCELFRHLYHASVVTMTSMHA